MKDAETTWNNKMDRAAAGVRSTLNSLRQMAQNQQRQAIAVDENQPRAEAVREGLNQQAAAYWTAVGMLQSDVERFVEASAYLEGVRDGQRGASVKFTPQDHYDFYVDVKSFLEYSLEEHPDMDDLVDGIRELAARSGTLDKLIKTLGLNRSADVVEQAEILAELAASAVKHAEKLPVDENSSIPPLDKMRAEKLAELGAQVKRINAKPTRAEVPEELASVPPKDRDPEPNNSLAGIYWVDEVVRFANGVGYLGYLGGDVRHPFIAELFRPHTGKAFWAATEVPDQEQLNYPDKAQVDTFKAAVALAQRDGEIARIKFKAYNETGGLLKGLVVTSVEVGMGWLRTGKMADVSDEQAYLLLQFPDPRGFFEYVKVSPSAARPPKLDELRLYQTRVLEAQLNAKSSNG